MLNFEHFWKWTSEMYPDLGTPLFRFLICHWSAWINPAVCRVQGKKPDSGQDQLFDNPAVCRVQGKKPDWGRDQLKHKDDDEKKGDEGAEHEESEEEEEEEEEDDEE